MALSPSSVGMQDSRFSLKKARNSVTVSNVPIRSSAASPRLKTAESFALQTPITKTRAICTCGTSARQHKINHTKIPATLPTAKKTRRIALVSTSVSPCKPHGLHSPPDTAWPGRHSLHSTPVLPSRQVPFSLQYPGLH